MFGVNKNKIAKKVARLVLVFVGIFAVGVLSYSQSASAYTNQSTAGATHNQTLYVYTNPGEFLSVVMNQDSTKPATNPTAADRVPVTITSPAGVVINCTISMSTPTNGCSQNDLTSNTAGVWSVKIGFTQRADGANASGTYQTPWILWSINVTAESTADWDFGPDTLSLGSSSIYVETLQEALNALIGAGITVDGTFGATTETAVRNFQTAAGLGADGVVGPTTKTAINEYKHPEITGRIWSERYVVLQTSNTNRIDDNGTAFSFWAVSDSGVQYKVNYPNYNGYTSAFSVNNLGIVTVSDCEPQYRSANFVEASGDPAVRSSAASLASCVGKQTNYRLFFQSPDESLPESIADWGENRAAASKWVSPEYRTAVLTNLQYSRNTASSAAGKIEFDLANQNGTTQIQIDVDGNGVFSDPIDRSVKSPVLKGHVSLNWNGLDGQGNPVSPDVKLSFRASLPTGGEIHFLSDDVEGRAGGIQIEQRTGPGKGSAKLNWDDTSFNKLCSRTPVTLQTMNTANCVTQPDGKFLIAKSGGLTFEEQEARALDSTGGIHFWNGSNEDNSVTASNAASFGDNRVIDEWAFVQDNANTLLLEWTPPVAKDDTATTQREKAVAIDILANDTDGSRLNEGGAIVQHPIDATTVKLQIPEGISGATLSASGKSLDIPNQGTYTVDSATGVVTFTPASGFTGEAEAVPYTVADSEGNLTAAHINITVIADAPIQAADDTTSTRQATPVTLDVLANDTDGTFAVDPATVRLQAPEGRLGASLSSDGKTLSIENEGVYQVAPDGHVTFTPEPLFTGSVTPVIYSVQSLPNARDTRSTDSAVIRISITADDTIVAADDTATTSQAIPVIIAVLDNDIGGTHPIDSSTVKLKAPSDVNSMLSEDGKTLAVSGEGTYTVQTDGSIMFTPEDSFTSSTTPITYTAKDTAGRTYSAFLSILVSAEQTSSTPSSDLLAETGQNFWALLAALTGALILTSVACIILLRRRKHSL